MPERRPRRPRRHTINIGGLRAVNIGAPSVASDLKLRLEGDELAT